MPRRTVSTRIQVNQNSPKAIAAASQLSAAVVLAPLLFVAPPRGPIDATVAAKPTRVEL